MATVPVVAAATAAIAGALTAATIVSVAASATLARRSAGARPCGRGRCRVKGHSGKVELQRHGHHKRGDTDAN